MSRYNWVVKKSRHLTLMQDKHVCYTLWQPLIQGEIMSSHPLTPYHIRYYAHELTKRCASDSVEKQRDLRKLETKRDEDWRDYDAASRELDRQKMPCWMKSVSACSKTPGRRPCS